jgi:hypothetical protein
VTAAEQCLLMGSDVWRAVTADGQSLLVSSDCRRAAATHGQWLLICAMLMDHAMIMSYEKTCRI